jgi:hypothetical protein
MSEVDRKLTDDLAASLAADLASSKLKAPSSTLLARTNGSGSFVDQYARMNQIHKTLRSQVRMQMLEMANQFHVSKLEMMMTHEQQLVDLADRHEAKMAELEMLLNKLGAS